MDFMLWSVAFVICLAVQVSSVLPPKPIGEWHPDRYEMYPNPWVNSSACQTTETSGLCDYNEILSPEQRKDLIEQPEMKKVSDADECLCNINCGAQMGIKVTVAIMKKIGPQISDYRAAANEFAEKFRPAWNLGNCSVILIVSKGDNVCFLDVGSAVNIVLSANETEQIEKCCSIGNFVGVVNETLIAYRNAQEAAAAAEAAAQTTASTPEAEAPRGSSAIIAGVTVAAVAGGIAASTIIALKIKKKADEAKAAEVEQLKSTPRDVMEGQNEAKAEEVEHLTSSSRDVTEGQNAFV